MSDRLQTFKRENPNGWLVIELLGSLSLAMLLILTLAVACAAATIMESKFTSDVARHYVYKAPWFFGWLLLLCVNLCCVTLTRLPWKRRHYGFVITHYGIILLLIGSVIGHIAGFEAFMILKVGGKPQSIATIHETLFIAQSPKDGNFYRYPLALKAQAPTESHPRMVDLPDSDLKIKLTGYSESLIQSPRLTPDLQGKPGVQLRFKSGMMKQAVPVALLDQNEHRDFDFFGLAKVEWHPSLAAADQRPRWRESQMVFRDHPPISDTETTHGYAFRLEKSGSGWRLLIQPPEGKPFTRSVPKSFPQSEKINGVLINYVGFWPDFAMKEGKPVTVSSQPKNPAILLQLVGSQPPTQQPLLLLAPEGNQIRYRLQRGSVHQSEGTLSVGNLLPLGWADWQMELVATESKAVMSHEIEPSERPTEKSRDGVRAELTDPQGKTISPPRWLAMGMFDRFQSEEGTINAGLRLRTQPLPFQVELVKFDVPRDEGTESPSNYISTVRFTDSTTGETREDLAQMNKPATFPGGLWRSIIGANYKFSQASWNPKDLGESTLQLLYDPGWLPKWIGSLMICCGIFTMFYLREERK